MKKKTLEITIIFVISTIIQVISNIIITRIFGTSSLYSHFLAAVTLPTIIVTVIYGTLNDALLPLYGEKIVKEKERSEEYFFGQLNSLILLGIGTAIILNLLSVPIMNLLFGSSSLDVKLLSQMISIMAIAIPFSVMVTILGMRYYAHKKFSRFPVAQAIGSFANLVMVVTLYRYLGVWGLVYSFVVNIIVQIFFVLPKSYQFVFGDIKNTIMLWLPLIIGIFALKSDSLFIRMFSAKLSEDFIVYHNLISKVCSLSAGLITIGIQVILLPTIIERISKGEIDSTKNLVVKVKIIAILLSILLIFSLYFIAPFFIKLLFVGGKFTLDDYQQSISLLPYYLLPVVGWSIVSVFLQPLYAIKKHLYVGVISLFCFALAWIVGEWVANTSPSLAISVSLTILLLGSVIGSEIVWQLSFRKLYMTK